MRDLIIRELGPDQDPILKRDRVISQKLGTMASHKPLKHLEAVVKLAKKNPPSHKTSKKIGGKPVYYAWCSKGQMNSWTHPDEVPRPRNHACICYGIKGRTIILYGVGALTHKEEDRWRVKFIYFGQPVKPCKAGVEMPFKRTVFGAGSDAGSDSDSDSA